MRSVVGGRRSSAGPSARKARSVTSVAMAGRAPAASGSMGATVAAGLGVGVAGAGAGEGAHHVGRGGRAEKERDRAGPTPGRPVGQLDDGRRAGPTPTIGPAAPG